MIKLNRTELYILPLLILIFFINFHYYEFYANKFDRFKQYLNLSYKNNQYEDIQKLHPYGPIYELSQRYKDSNEPVIFVFINRHEGNLDYTTTYYINSKITEKKKFQNAYLSELGLYITYYFYPREIPIYSIKKYNSLPLPSGSLIITDFNIINHYGVTNKRNLKPIVAETDEFNAIDLRKRNSYFAYEVI